MVQSSEYKHLDRFVAMLDEHRRDFDGFMHDIESVRFCRTPLDTQQINRCEYALRNMEMRLMTLQDCIGSAHFTGRVHEDLVSTKSYWVALVGRANDYVTAIQKVISSASHSMSAVRRILADGQR